MGQRDHYASSPYRLAVFAGAVAFCLSLALVLPMLPIWNGPDESDARPPAKVAVPARDKMPEESFHPQQILDPLPPVTDGIKVLSAREAQGKVFDEEFVLGLAVSKHARAYPINMLSDPSREILNDAHAGRPIAVTWCDRCQSAVVFDRRTGGKTLTLFTTGARWKDNMVMQDKETSSLWLQISGRAESGPLKGRELEILPSAVTDWASWRANHPDTTVLMLPRVARRYVHHSRYAQFPPERDFFDHLLVGVRGSERHRAWLFAALRKHPVVNDDMDKVPVLVVFDSLRSSAQVFRRDVDGRTLTFRRLDGKHLRDDQTGTTWNAFVGQATAGRLLGYSLRPVPATVALSSAWMDLFPSTELGRTVALEELRAN